MIASSFQALIIPSAAQPSAVSLANARNDEGVVLWQAGRRSDAVAAFTEAARSDGRFPVPWHNLGAVYLIEGQFEQAVAALQQAVRRAPGWALTRTHLAQAYLRTGNAMAALEESDAARALDPSLPDVRGELRVLLQARLQVTGALAKRRRNYFIFSLVVAAFVTLLTAGIGFATLAVPIYRFLVFSQARRDRDAAHKQLAALDAAPVSRAGGATPPASAGEPAVVSQAGAPYVVAGRLPPFSLAEFADERAPSGTGYRGFGWTLLIFSVLTLAGGVAGLALERGAAPGLLPRDLDQALVMGVFPFLLLSALSCMVAVLIGAVAAFRRHRLGWAIGMLIIGGLGSFIIVPAQIMILLLLVAMPHKPAVRGLELVPVPQITLGNGQR